MAPGRSGILPEWIVRGLWTEYGPHPYVSWQGREAVARELPAEVVVRP